MESTCKRGLSWRHIARLFNFIVFLFAGMFFSLAAEDIAEAATTLRIRDDSAGGDCLQAGTWDPGSRTCTLTADSNHLFIIESDGVTLDGAGHTLTGAGPVDPAYFVPGPDGGGFAVDVTGRSGVTVRNLNLTRHDYGVHLNYSNNVTITGVTTSFSGLAGISLSYSGKNTVSGNSIANPNLNTGICIGYASSNNIITDNRVSGSDRGIYLHDGSNGNEISGNRLDGNLWGLTLWINDSYNRVAGNDISGGLYGIYLHSSNINNDIFGNTISGNATGIRIDATGTNHVINNNLRGNTIQALMTGAGGIFNHVAPEGGNYWDDYDSPAEGCHDENSDSFCDSPYIFSGGADQLPRVDQSVWPCIKPALATAAGRDWWASYSEYLERELSVEYTITNRGIAHAYNVAINASVCSGGVYVTSALPVDVAASLSGNSGAEQATLKYHVPEGMATFRTVIFATAADGCNGIHYYPDDLSGH
ncbi:MAG: NosD domain-containing protein [Thermoleophilia bacterium]